MSRILYSCADEMVQMLEAGCDLNEFENHFYKLAQADSAALANEIKNFNLSGYTLQLKKVFGLAIDLARKKNFTAIYFEFDPTSWSGGFFLCKYYVPKSLLDATHTEYWVSEWEEEYYNGVLDLPEFGMIFHARSRGKYITSELIKVYLFARTFAAITSVYRQIEINDMAICCAFHDGPVVRLQEYFPPANLIFDGSEAQCHVPPEMVKLSKLESYVLQYHYRLFDPPCRCHIYRVVLPVDPVNDPRVRVPELLAKYKDKIFINYCPFCGEVRITPKAKQCLSCNKREN